LPIVKIVHPLELPYKITLKNSYDTKKYGRFAAYVIKVIF